MEIKRIWKVGLSFQSKQAHRNITDSFRYGYPKREISFFSRILNSFTRLLPSNKAFTRREGNIHLSNSHITLVGAVIKSILHVFGTIVADSKADIDSVFIEASRIVQSDKDIEKMLGHGVSLNYPFAVSSKLLHVNGMLAKSVSFKAQAVGPRGSGIIEVSASFQQETKQTIIDNITLTLKSGRVVSVPVARRGSKIIDI